MAGGILAPTMGCAAKHLTFINVLAASTAVALAILLGHYYLTHPRVEFDSLVVARAVIIADASIRHGVYYCPDAGYGGYPLFQHLTGWGLFRFGGEEGFVEWCTISTFAFFACFVVMFQQVRRVTRSVGLAAAACLILLCGPLLAYGASSFNEMTAALVTLVFTAVSLRPGPRWLMVVLFVVAGVTKEVAFPFLSLIWLVGIYVHRRGQWRQMLGDGLALLVANGLTFATSAMFNVFRFGRPWNQYMLRDYLIVQDAWRHLEYFAGLWFSPSGGLVWFWPGFAVVFVAVLLIELKPWRVRLGNLSVTAPAWGLAALLLGLLIGFSRFVSPFGWWCWGPRYLLPWIPSLLLMLFCYYPQQLHLLMLGALKPLRRSQMVAGLLALLAMPQMLILYSFHSIPAFFAPDERFPTVIPPQMPEAYRQIMHYFIWQKWPMLLRVVSDCDGNAALGPTLLFVLTIVTGVFFVRAQLLQAEAPQLG